MVRRLSRPRIGVLLNTALRNHCLHASIEISSSVQVPPDQLVWLTRKESMQRTSTEIRLYQSFHRSPPQIFAPHGTVSQEEQREQR